ncbi:hypothetical protein CRENBAI_019264 [Crenichthys baileyi]|uniref:Uncharacterized protein n=1 Tax=Crenichthys baileyi TaxID=28760 RepID=A0AAV9RQM5_9TELE
MQKSYTLPQEGRDHPTSCRQRIDQASQAAVPPPPTPQQRPHVPSIIGRGTVKDHTNPKPKPPAEPAPADKQTPLSIKNDGPARKPTLKPTNGREPTVQKSKTHQSPETSPHRDQPWPTRPVLDKPCRLRLANPLPRQNQVRRQELESRQGTRIRTGNTQILRPASRVRSLKERAPVMRWYLPASLGGTYAHRCTEGPRASAGCQSIWRPKTPVT